MDDFPSSTSTTPPPSPTTSSGSMVERRVALAVGLAILWGAFTLLAQLSGALDAFEDPLLDWQMSLAAYPAPPSDQLALVYIDNIPPDRPWPWSRLDYSLVLRSLIDYAPQSVVFEMNLNDRDTEYNSFDDTFSHIVLRANSVVFAATVMTSSSNASPPARLSTIPYHGNPRQVPHYSSAIWPLDTFAGGSPVGANNLESEAGLRMRSLPLIFVLNGKVIPSLVLQASAQLLGADLNSSDIQVGRAIFLRRKDGRLMRTIPIDDEGRMSIRFHPGPATSWQASFDNILLFDDQIQHGIKPAQQLRDLLKRQVWIGRTDPGERERFRTAVGPLSRVEVQLQAERTILDQDYVRPLPPMILAVLYLLVAIGGGVAVIRWGPIHSGAGMAVVAAFWFELSILVFRVYNVILPLPSFAMLIFGTYVVSMLAAHWDLEPEPEEEE